MQRLGSYQLEGFLAKGGQGAVYRARHVELGTPAAVKVFEGRDAKQLARFEREARILVRLPPHPSLLRVFDFGRDGPRAWLAMELVQGEDLGSLLKRAGRTPDVAWTCRTLAAAADAVAFCHRHGVLHRDLKPANILLEPKSGRVVLADFGLLLLSSDSDVGSLDAQRLSLTGEVRGTPAFMPPEQAEGDRDALGPPADVYSLGATLYYLLTGRPPFEGSSTVNVLYKVLSEPPPDPRHVAPEVPAELATLCRSAMAKDPAQRPQSARAFAAELRRIGASLQGDRKETPGEPPASIPSTADAPPSPGRARRRGVLAAALGVPLVLGLLAALAASWLAGHRPSNSPPLPDPPRRDSAPEPAEDLERQERDLRLPADIAIHALVEFQGALVAGTYGAGVFRSDDDGRRWTYQNAGLSCPEVLCLRVDRKEPDVIYAGTSFRGGLYASRDGLRSWQLVLHDRSDVRAIAQTAEGTLYVATSAGAVFALDGDGASARRVDADLPGAPCRALVADPERPRTLYLALEERGIFRTADGGKSWQPAARRQPHGKAWALGFGPDGALYAGLAERGVYRADRDGWTRVGPENYPRERTKAIVNDLVAWGGALFAATSGGVLRYAGGAWRVLDEEAALSFLVRKHRLYVGGESLRTFALRATDRSAAGAGSRPLRRR
ncbi:MAG: hypothetical protein D6731_05925 [Planctomycetota bacterium]|nr:MAG: hypothetical protein D6731_05925 [Planctomycetota bacterium]